MMHDTKHVAMWTALPYSQEKIGIVPNLLYTVNGDIFDVDLFSWSCSATEN